MNNLIAKSTIAIDVPVSKVWEALTNPSIIKEYMFGTEVVSDWKEGSSIVWKGIWKEKPYEDKGVILTIIPNQTLSYSHFSPLSGVPDTLENYRIVTYELSGDEEHAVVSLSQDNNANEEELTNAKQMWDSMLLSLKKLLEGK